MTKTWTEIVECLAKEKNPQSINVREEFMHECWDCDRVGYLLSYQTPGQARKKAPDSSLEYCTLYCAKCGATHRITRKIVR